MAFFDKHNAYSPFAMKERYLLCTEVLPPFILDAVKSLCFSVLKIASKKARIASELYDSSWFLSRTGSRRSLCG